MCCSTAPSKEVVQGDNEEQMRLDDEVIDLSGSESMSFDDDIEVLEEYVAVAQPSSKGINFQRPSARKSNVSNIPRRRLVPAVSHEVDDNGYCAHHPDIQLYRRRSDDPDDWAVVRKKCPNCMSNDCPEMLGDCNNDTTSNICKDEVDKSNLKKRNSFVQSIVNDFSPNGDQKILRAVGRTATVNAAVLLTAATGGLGASAVGYATGGAITAKRLSDGVAKKDDKEVTKSLAVFGCATGASIAGQALTGALMLGVVGASLPVAGAVAFGVGCASGISAGALSEWTVDGIMDKKKTKRDSEVPISEVQNSDEGIEKETRDEATASRSV